MMTKMQRVAATSFLVVQVALLTSSWGGDVPKESALVVRVTGAVENGRSTLAVEAGSTVTRGCAIYSEPSHELMVIVVETQFAHSDEGTQWVRDTMGGKRAKLAGANLPLSIHPLSSFPAPPQTDVGISVVASGEFPFHSDGGEAVVLDAEVNAADFEVAAFFDENDTTTPWILCCGPRNGASCCRGESPTVICSPDISKDLACGADDDSG